ncbi:importin subunit beta-1-like, partial [Triticum dicoccoides]|uniref:importin subunit beta-1-like n=1 Tax=Triticum dicoccoides TaxID=85692 RepID=UPI00188E74DB
MECLSLAAISIGDAIVPPVMRFFEVNIIAPDWQSRKAATFALGYILEGPCLKKLAPVINPLLDMMKDPNMHVRGTTAWTLQRLFELRHSQASPNRIITNANLPRIVAVLIESSKDVSEVSEKVSGAIYFLARGYGEDTKSKSKPNSPELSPYVRPVIDALLSATEPTPFGLPACASAYEALTEIVRVSNTREFEASLAIRTLMPSIMRRLNMVLNHDGVVISSGDKMNRGLLEVLLCGLVQLIIEKMGSWDIIERSALRDSAQCVLLLLCRALTSDSSSARDKAALAIGALAHSIGPDFGEHMPMLLQYFTVKRLSPTYLEVMCDICHVLGDKVAVTCCDQIMDVLYKGMSDVALIHSIMACFGEI